MDRDAYYPPPESEGGWRTLEDPAAVREVAGMDPDALDEVVAEQRARHGEHSWSVVVVRRGHCVRAFSAPDVAGEVRFDVKSVTKSFAGTAWGLLLEDCRRGKRQDRRDELPREVALDSPAYAYLPAGHPLSDRRKWGITVEHLLSMTSGIPGEDHGVFGMRPAPDADPFEYALGKAPDCTGVWVDTLFADPGTAWCYSDPAFNHLSPVFAAAAGREMDEVLRERVLDPIGVDVEWNRLGADAHTQANSGLRVSAPDLARFGYLMLRGGLWEGERLVPEWWLERATTSSQEMNPDYGLTWWVNEGATAETDWPGVPGDAFAAMGYNNNKCYVVPALDLVVARVADGPAEWEESRLIGGVADAVVDA